MDRVFGELEALPGRFGNLCSIYNFFNRELVYPSAKNDSTLGFLSINYMGYREDNSNT